MRARGGKNSQENVNQPTIRMSPKKSSNNPGTPPNLETTPNAEMARRPSAFSLARAAQGKSYPTGKKDQSLTQNAHPTLRAVTNTGTPINLGQLPIQAQRVSRATPGPEDWAGQTFRRSNLSRIQLKIWHGYEATIKRKATLWQNDSLFDECPALADNIKSGSKFVNYCRVEWYEKIATGALHCTLNSAFPCF